MLRSIALSFLLLIGVILVACQPVVPDTPPTELANLSIDDLISQATQPTYDDLFRNNETHVGQLVYYRAQIIQVVQAGEDRYQLRANVTQSQFFWEDP